MCTVDSNHRDRSSREQVMGHIQYQHHSAHNLWDHKQVIKAHLDFLIRKKKPLAIYYISKYYNYSGSLKWVSSPTYPPPLTLLTDRMKWGKTEYASRFTATERVCAAQSVWKGLKVSAVAIIVRGRWDGEQSWEGGACFFFLLYLLMWFQQKRWFSILNRYDGWVLILMSIITIIKLAAASNECGLLQ